MTHSWVLTSLLACCVATGLNPASGQTTGLAGTPLVLYDNFNGQRIDPAKWTGWTSTSLLGEAELVRELDPAWQGQGNNRRLHLLAQDYSQNSTDGGGWFGLLIADSGPVKEVSFTLAVNSAVSGQCQNNSIWSATFAGFYGRFFNYGDGSVLDEDVWASVDLSRDGRNPTGPLIVEASVGSDGRLGFANYQELGRMSVGQNAKVRVRWDQPNRQFLFQINSNPVVAIAYSVMDAAQPNFPGKQLWQWRYVPACESSTSVLMDAYFDNVYIGLQ